MPKDLGILCLAPVHVVHGAIDHSISGDVVRLVLVNSEGVANVMEPGQEV